MKTIETLNGARRSRQIEEMGATLCDYQSMGRLYVTACETGCDTALREYYLAVQRHYHDVREISLAYWRLGASLAKSLSELWLIVTMVPSPLVFEAMQREIDEAFDFFVHGWESGIFTDDAYERLCDLSNVAQERLEEAMAA